MRKLLVAVGVGLIGVAVAVVPLPLILLSPAPAISVTEHLTVQGVDGAVSGKMMLTAVKIDEPSAFETVLAWFDDDEEIGFRPTAPPGIDDDDFEDFQLQLFDESVQVAAAVGMRAADLEVTVSGGGVRVVGVVDNSPAEGELETGDVITHVNGRTVEFAASLVAVTGRASAGDAVDLRVRRGDRTLTMSIELDEIDELNGRPGLGVAVRTLDPEIELPRDVEIDLSEVGGPSGGLMMALSVYDLVSDDDVAAARTIAGTGTIDITGSVGEVGEVDLKVAAAERAGADIFLVPENQGGDAEKAAGSIEIVPVATFEDALQALVG